MSFGSILLGALIGGVISGGGIIGITFLTSVPAILWWHMLLIAVGGTIIGGFIGGLIARGAGAGALAGLLSGLIVFLAVFIFTWRYYQAQLLSFLASASDLNELVTNFLTMLGMEGTEIGTMISTWITTNAPSLAEIEAFATSKFIYLALILGAVFGGIASAVNLIAGLIGGAITKKKQESYDSYY
ncbi:MAG: hypothetical protein FK734_04000 [Asgard group archaeon]|nr:hypothetical protein [Asgard group archaeon]